MARNNYTPISFWLSLPLIELIQWIEVNNQVISKEKKGEEEEEEKAEREEEKEKKMERRRRERKES